MANNLADAAESLVDAVEGVAETVINASKEMLNEALGGSGEDGGDNDDGGDDEEDSDEHIHVDERFIYLEHVVRTLSIIHSLISLAMLIAYYHLKGNRLEICYFHGIVKILGWYEIFQFRWRYLNEKRKSRADLSSTVSTSSSSQRMTISRPTGTS